MKPRLKQKYIEIWINYFGCLVIYYKNYGEFRHSNCNKWSYAQTSRKERVHKRPEMFICELKYKDCRF